MSKYASGDDDPDDPDKNRSPRNNNPKTSWTSSFKKKHLKEWQKILDRIKAGKKKESGEPEKSEEPVRKSTSSFPGGILKPPSPAAQQEAVEEGRRPNDAAAMHRPEREDLHVEFPELSPMSPDDELVPEEEETQAEPVPEPEPPSTNPNLPTSTTPESTALSTRWSSRNPYTEIVVEVTEIGREDEEEEKEVGAGLSMGLNDYLSRKENRRRSASVTFTPLDRDSPMGDVINSQRRKGSAETGTLSGEIPTTLIF